MDEDVRAELRALRTEMDQVKTFVEKVHPWSKNVERMLELARFQGDAMQFAVVEVFAKLAAGMPDPDAVLAAALNELDREATRFVGASESTSAEGSNETAMVIARIRTGAERRLRALQAGDRRGPA